MRSGLTFDKKALGVRSNVMTRPTQAFRLGGDLSTLKRPVIMTIKVLGIDLGKRYFHVHAVDATGILLERKRLRRKELLEYLSNLTPVSSVWRPVAVLTIWPAKHQNLAIHQN